MNSIRVRILTWLLACVTVVTIAAGWGVYRFVLADADELFDYQLRQIALSLRDQGVAQASAESSASYEIIVQIWNEGGARIYLSHPYSDLPEQAILGFDNVHAESGDWRVFSVQVRGRTIQVAQPMSVRRELARAHALRSLLPVLVLLPLLAVALWFGVVRALGPMSVIAREVGARAPDLLVALPEERLPNEIVPLVRALNNLLLRLAAARDAQRAFVADAAIKAPKHPLALGSGNSRSTVRDLENCSGLAPQDTHVHTASGWRIAHRVIREVSHEHAQRIGVTSDGRFLCNGESEVDTACVGERCHVRYGHARDLIEPCPDFRALGRIGFVARERKQLVDETRGALDSRGKKRSRRCLRLRVGRAVEELHLEAQCCQR